MYIYMCVCVCVYIYIYIVYINPYNSTCFKELCSVEEF